MKIRVMKFGGTSVATPEARLQSAIRVTSTREQGYDPIVVVSAIGRKGAPYATDTLLGLLREIDPTVDPDDREVDLMIACGEIFSAVIFAQTLKTLGHPAQAFRGGQAGIRTDGVYGNARIVGINPVALQSTLQAGVIPVVCGFQGVYISGEGMPGGELTTLGRGGSDTTAAALGAATLADAVEIYTDVEGVKTADPDFVPNASTLRRVSYDEVAEIAHLGAKVLHPRAAEIAMKFNIPLWVKSTFSQDRGTEIVNSSQVPERRVTGVTHTGKLVYMQFLLQDVQSEPRVQIESRIYELMAKYGINLHMMNLSQSAIGFAVPRDQFAMAEDLLDGLVIPIPGDSGGIFMIQMGREASLEAETQAHLLSALGKVHTVVVELTEGCTMVSVIGHGYMQQAGVFYRVLKVLHDHQIKVLQTSDSDLSLSCLISESETHRAVSVLHSEFDLASVS